MAIKNLFQIQSNNFAKILIPCCGKKKDRGTSCVCLFATSKQPLPHVINRLVPPLIDTRGEILGKKLRDAYP